MEIIQDSKNGSGIERIGLPDYKSLLHAQQEENIARQIMMPFSNCAAKAERGGEGDRQKDRERHILRIREKSYTHTNLRVKLTVCRMLC